MSGSSTQMQIDVSAVVTRVKTAQEARSLPAGTVVGDTHGGVTFSDAVARELEKRSHCGWCDVNGTHAAISNGASMAPSTNRWTVIILNR